MMNLVENQIGILWLFVNLFGVLQSQSEQFYWIPSNLETAQAQSNPGYVILQQNNKKSSHNSLNPLRDLYNNYKYKTVPNSEYYNQGSHNYNYNNYRHREIESHKDSYYNYYVNDKSNIAHKTSDKEKNTPQLHFRELDDLKVQPRKTMNNSLSKKPKTSEHIETRSVNYKTTSRKMSQEEMRRIARQTRKQRPGFFWTLFRVAFETVNDTRSAINQISELVNNNIAPDPITKKPGTPGMLVQATTLKSVSENATSDSSTTTSEAPFVLTRTGLQGIIRRNVKGLVRLFNIEWRDALNQSQVTVKEFQRDLGNQIGTYLRNNPNAY